ncbi:MAG TPA: BREX-1 system adenine-specific DNA-methyltransferase PglX [Candidatus Wallbacteria bacterium]|nr:BREX-1 system adenine-specific DNA-methyltransferase PglX [Candidatus Wallbacteria bacterium]
MNDHFPECKGKYIRLVSFKGGDEEMASHTLDAIKGLSNNIFFRASSSDFKKIPGSPIAYWVSEKVIANFSKGIPLFEYAVPRQGFATGNNDLFLKFWSEVSINNIKFNSNTGKEAELSNCQWFPCNKGGTFRKWFGNNNIIADWKNNGLKMKSYIGSVIRNPDYYFKDGMTWSTISSYKLSMRYSPKGYLFETKGSVCFPLNNNPIEYSIGLMNSIIIEKILYVLSPTLDFHEGPIGKVPIIIFQKDYIIINVKKLINISKSDWDSYETSWDFTRSPLLDISNISGGAQGESSDLPDSSTSPSLSALRSPLSTMHYALSDIYPRLRSRWRDMTLEMKRLEEENNRIFIDAYGLSDELTPDVPLSEITLTCNPHYRYGGDKTEEELEALLLADTMKEFISYSVGCMFGRYSLDRPGLVLANQGDTVDDYLKQIPNPVFPPDADNVIPILDGEWFPDDITERFYNFLRAAFGAEHFEDNLKFIETAIGKDIRKYFTKDFYGEHIKRYKKRPIYWLFTSPKGSFNALIYMHRYRPDTVSIVLNDYLREFKTKLASQKSNYEHITISSASSASEKTKALKEIDKIKKILAELDEYERDTLYPLAARQIAIDLDDGVKVNYQKFGAALKKIPGLEDKEE